MDLSSRAAINRLNALMDDDSPEPPELDRRLLDLDIAFNPPLPHPYGMVADVVEDIVERAQQHLLNLHQERQEEENRVRVCSQRAGTLWPVEKSSCLEGSEFCSRALSCDSWLYASGSKGTHAFAVSPATENIEVVSPPGNEEKAKHIVISQLNAGETCWDILACSTERPISGDNGHSRLTGGVTLYAFNSGCFAMLSSLGEQEGITSQVFSVELSTDCDILATILAGGTAQPGLILLYRLPRQKWQMELANFKQQVNSAREVRSETGEDVNLASIAATVHVNFSKPTLTLRIHQPLSKVQASGAEGLAPYQMPSFPGGADGYWPSADYTKARLADFQSSFCPAIPIEQLAEDIRTVVQPGTPHVRLLRKRSQASHLAENTTHCAVWFDGSEANDLFYYTIPPADTKATDAMETRDVQTFLSPIIMATQMTPSGWIAVGFQDGICLVQRAVEGGSIASVAVPKQFGSISSLLLIELSTIDFNISDGGEASDGTLVIGCDSGAVLFLHFCSFRTCLAPELERCQLRKHIQPGRVVDLSQCQWPSPDLVLSVHEDGLLIFHQVSTFQALRTLQPPEPYAFKNSSGSVALSKDGHYLFAQCEAVEVLKPTSNSAGKKTKSKTTRTEVKFAVCHINLESLSWPEGLQYPDAVEKQPSLLELCNAVTLEPDSMTSLVTTYLQRTFGSQTIADRAKLMASFEEGEETQRCAENVRRSQKIQEELEAARRSALEELDRFAENAK